MVDVLCELLVLVVGGVDSCGEGEREFIQSFVLGVVVFVVL